MIAIIDYDAGNIKSVEKAFAYLGYETITTRDSEIILSADKVILPGVGSFGDAMARLEEFGLIEVIHKVVEKNIPLLGICLGLQLMFDSSEESEGVRGLGVFKGRIIRFSDNTEYKIPQIGWNSLEIREDSKLFNGIPDQSYVYFVHSYYLEAENKAIVAASAEYANHFHAAVEYGNVYACQFHPEKSGDVGLRILKNFADL